MVASLPLACNLAGNPSYDLSAVPRVYRLHGAGEWWSILMAEGGNTAAPSEHPVDGSATAPAIVGIGASAGGVQALQAFFQALPANTGAAFVVIVHLDPRGHSELPSILAARTAMPVVQVGASEPLQPNTCTSSRPTGACTSRHTK
jgi:chemotaxis response regulator CheB